MSIVRKARAVGRIFAELDKEIESFQLNSGLNCVAGCGICCKKPDIEATVIEYIPIALFYFKNNQAESVLAHLNRHPDPVCHVFRAGVGEGSGFCTNYQYRGLICRLFGFSARKNKYGEPELVTCKRIKDLHPREYIQAYLEVKNKMPVPLMSVWYNKLMKIDFELAGKYYPVNMAIKKAIEMILSYYSYRRKPVWKSEIGHTKGSTPSPGVSQDLMFDPQ